MRPAKDSPEERVERRYPPRLKVDVDGWAYDASPSSEDCWLIFLCLAAKLGRFGPLGGFLDIT